MSRYTRMRLRLAVKRFIASFRITEGCLPVEIKYVVYRDNVTDVWKWEVYFEYERGCKRNPFFSRSFTSRLSGNNIYSRSLGDISSSAKNEAQAIAEAEFVAGELQNYLHTITAIVVYQQLP